MKFNYKRSIYIALASAFLTVVASGFSTSCNHDHDDHDHEHEHEEAEEHHHEAGEIVLSPEKAKQAGVTVENITASPFTEVIATSGQILPTATGQITVSATRPGIITLAKPWTSGMAISAGTPLFYISQDRLPEGSMTKRASIELNRAKAEYDRISALYADQLAQASEYENAKAAYEDAKLSYDALAGGGGISATKGGYVLQCLVKDGDYVETGAPLMVITSTMRLQLTADLPIRYAGKISEYQSANFRIAGNETVYSLSTLNGRMISHSSIADSGSPYVTITFDFDNAPGVVSGSFAEVYLLGAPRENVIAVPVTAITEEQGVYYIYIQKDEDCYEKRRVTLGATDGKNVEVTSGMKSGENVVVTGAMAVRLASMSTAIPGHTHNH